MLLESWSRREDKEGDTCLSEYCLGMITLLGSKQLFVDSRAETLFSMFSNKTQHIHAPPPYIIYVLVI